MPDDAPLSAERLIDIAEAAETLEQFLSDLTEVAYSLDVGVPGTLHHLLGREFPEAHRRAQTLRELLPSDRDGVLEAEGWPMAVPRALLAFRAILDKIARRMPLSTRDQSALRSGCALLRQSALVGQGTDTASAIGRGVAPRDAKFLEWYEARGTETYHKPAKCWAKWQGMRTEQRAAICPDAPNKITKAAVVQAIKRARLKRDGKKSKQPKPKQRKKR